MCSKCASYRPSTLPTTLPPYHLTTLPVPGHQVGPSCLAFALLVLLGVALYLAATAGLLGECDGGHTAHSAHSGHRGQSARMAKVRVALERHAEREATDPEPHPDPEPDPHPDPDPDPTPTPNLSPNLALEHDVLRLEVAMHDQQRMPTREGGSGMRGACGLREPIGACGSGPRLAKVSQPESTEGKTSTGGRAGARWPRRAAA